MVDYCCFLTYFLCPSHHLLPTSLFLQQRTPRIFSVPPHRTGSPAQQAATRVAVFYSYRHYGNHAQEPVPASVRAPRSR
jgi:hypothetical protein